MLASSVHSLLHTSLIFTYWSASDPPSPSHDSSAESVTSKGNPKPSKNPPNLVPNVPDDPYSDPSLSDSSSSESSDSSDDEYYKQRQHSKKEKNKHQSKTLFSDPIKNCAKLASKLLTAAYKSKVVKFKLDNDPLQRRVYFISLLD